MKLSIYAENLIAKILKVMENFINKLKAMKKKAFNNIKKKKKKKIKNKKNHGLVLHLFLKEQNWIFRTDRGEF